MALTVTITIPNPRPDDAHALITLAKVISVNWGSWRGTEEDMDLAFTVWDSDLPAALKILAMQVNLMGTDLFESGVTDDLREQTPQWKTAIRELGELVTFLRNEPETTEDEALLERLGAWLRAIDRMYGDATVPELVLVSDGAGRIVDAQGYTLFEFGCLDTLSAHLTSSINEALT